jgi:predicted metal-dependent phosphoesterase TrpH
MPARQPFTALCRTATRLPGSGRVDLHVHTTHSDGAYTPAEVVHLARRSGLAAVAITDHDTLAGVAAARAAAGPGLEVVPGVEITAELDGREMHLLGYFVRLEDTSLHAALDELRRHREARFLEMVDRLRNCGVSVDREEVQETMGLGTVGRRHLAHLLVRARRAGSVREAFTRFLGDRGRVAVAKRRLPVARAIALVRGAGGVAAWAHPSYDCTRETLGVLRALGLRALEAGHPAHRASRVRALRARAAEFGMAVTGGSDCHGPGSPRRAVGACTISAEELASLRRLASERGD